MNEEPENANETPAKTNRKPLIAAAVVVFAIAASAIAFYVYRNRGGELVPAPKNVTFDNGGGDASMPAMNEETVTIPAEQVERIGLKSEVAGETMAADASETSASGVVEANAFQSTPAIALTGGILRRISVEPGVNVSKGQALAVIFSEEFAAAQSKYLQLLTDARTARQSLSRAEKLVAINPAGTAERDEALAKLKTAEAALTEHHQHHLRAEKLLKIGAVSREEYEQANSEYQAADAEFELAKSRYERALRVAAINPESRGELESVQLRVQTADSELAGARQKLELYGMSASRIDSLRSPSQITSELVVTAPVSGTVTARSVNGGEVVEANKELLKITNLSSVWAIAQVYEKDLALMRVGSGASVTSDAFPGRVFRGQITYVDPNINPETRTAQVRVELANPADALKIGMFVKVSFGALGNAEKTAPVVSSSAVQNVRGQSVVFVMTDKPGVFTMKPVRLGPEKEGRFTVLEGLTVGEKVVTEGSFLLRAEVLKK